MIDNIVDNYHKLSPEERAKVVHEILYAKFKAT